MILLVSDLDLKGSGYMQIAIGLAQQMAARGHKVKVLGFGYEGGEHNWPFSIIPVRAHEAWLQTPNMVHNLVMLGQAGQSDPVEALIVALDIPHQARALMMPHADYPYVGVFPIESGPLCPTWANVVAGMDAALVISKFGAKQILDVGGKATYLPIGLDTASWRLPEAGERETIRKQMDLGDYFVVLTVADNQERKNLSAGMAAIAKLRDAGIPVRWMLVTRVESPVGWRLQDLAWKHDLQENVMTFERGIPHDRLWLLHAAADAFLLTSKSEGLCMPIMESMACGLPVAATDCTAISEHLWEDPERHKGQRGFPIQAEYKHLDPWGNSIRHYASADSAAKQLTWIYRAAKKHDKRLAEIVQRARWYVESRSWDVCGGVLEEGLQGAIAKYKQAKPQDLVVPPTVPSLVPLFHTPEVANG